MAETLTITKTEGSVKILHLAGKLDGQTHHLLLEAAQAERAAGARFLLIDLQKIEMISSAGLGALHHIFKMFTPQEELDAWENENHGDVYKSPYVKLAGASTNVYYVLNIAGFLHNIPVYATVKEALDSFPGRVGHGADQNQRPAI
jgi:ABC-type transporter Mla MlaB component